MRSSLSGVVKTGSCSNCGATFDKVGTEACPVCGMPAGDAGADVAVRPRPRPQPGALPRHATASAQPKRAQVPVRTIAVLCVLALGVVGVVAAVATSRDTSVAQQADATSDATGAAPAEQITEAEPTPPDEAPTARFTFHRKRESLGGTFYVLGEVENTSSFAIRKPELVIILLDEAGNEVATDSGFALAEILEPGEKSYLSAVVTSPPVHHDLKFEVAPRKATYRPALAQGLTVEPLKPQVQKSGLHKFSGSVKNTGATTAKFVNVQVLAFDAEDKLMGVYSTYAKTDSLAPGDKARFTVTGVGLEPTPARFEYLVTARVAE